MEGTETCVIALSLFWGSYIEVHGLPRWVLRHGAPEVLEGDVGGRGEEHGERATVEGVDDGEEDPAGGGHDSEPAQAVGGTCRLQC